MKELTINEARKVIGGKYITLQVFLGSRDYWSWNWCKFGFSRVTRYTYKRFYDDGTWSLFEYDQWH